MVKTMVLDTSVIMHDWQAPFNFKDNDVVVPMVVIEELENNKTRNDEKGKNARRFIDKLDTMEEDIGFEEDGTIMLDNGGTLRVELNNVKSEVVEQVLTERSNDNRIVSVAVNLKGDGHEVVVVTNDKAMRIKARRLGLKAESYMTDKMVNKLEDVYSGIVEINTADEVIGKIYSKSGKISMDDLENMVGDLSGEEIYVNTFLKITGFNSSILMRVVKRAGKLYADTLNVLGDNETVFESVRPKNSEQRMALEVLLDDTVDLVVLNGTSGSGKTLLSLAAGLHGHAKSDTNRALMITKAEESVGNDRGFLPGNDLEKTMPWMDSVLDNLEFLYNCQGNKKKLNEILAFMEDVITFEALAYMRGRSIPNRFILIDEGQNMTPHEMKTMITRAGEGTKYVVVGDPTQIDTPYLDSENNGLVYLMERFKNSERSAVLKLPKGVRSALAEEAALLL